MRQNYVRTKLSLVVHPERPAQCIRMMFVFPLHYLPISIQWPFPVITCTITKNSEQRKYALSEKGSTLVFTERPPMQVIALRLPHNLPFHWKFFRGNGHAKYNGDFRRQSTLEMQGNAFISMLMTQVVALTWHKSWMLFLKKFMVSCYFLGKQYQFKRQKWEN